MFTIREAYLRKLTEAGKSEGGYELAHPAKGREKNFPGSGSTCTALQVTPTKRLQDQK